MRIITAEIINGMNRPEADTPEFDSKWEECLENLAEHNNKLAEKCLPSVAKFINNVHLFEAAVHTRSFNFSNDSYQFVVGIPSEAIYSLSYEITADPVIIKHEGSGFDADQKSFWLYDEFHKIDNHYEHHIIFSDGYEFQVPFVFFYTRKQSWFEE